MSKPTLIFGLIIYFLYVPCSVLAIILFFNLLPNDFTLVALREYAVQNFRACVQWFQGNGEPFPIGILPFVLAAVVILVGFLYTTILSLKFHAESISNSLDSAIENYKKVTDYDPESWSISSSGDIEYHGGTEQHSGSALVLFILGFILRIVITPITFPIETVIHLINRSDTV